MELWGGDGGYDFFPEENENARRAERRAATRSGVLRAAAGRERVTLFGSLIEWLATELPLGGTDDMAMEVQRGGTVIARRTFRKLWAAEGARSRLAERVEAMTDEEFGSTEDWQAEFDRGLKVLVRADAQRVPHGRGSL